MRTYTLVSLAVLISLLSGCNKDSRLEEIATESTTESAENASLSVTGDRLLNAAHDTSSWLTHGRTYSEQRFVPLDRINSQNVGELGLAWYFDIPTRRGIEATPLVIDGVMYVTGAWSIVYALDARTGEALWVYDPQVPREYGRYACCDAVNRGVAAWGDKIYVGTLDGYLVALNANDGSVAWRVNTIDRDKPYTITGAPRAIKGRVFVGNGGGEYGVRGYITAYDAETGEQVWRFHTVPGNPADGYESPAMEMAAETWTGEWWTMGGGGTVWDSMAYDPELDLLYIGVGNGSPWNRQIRSPGGGDNLFLSSIVALRPDTGEYVWHYQTTPGETWDFTATQHIILADLEIAGETRKVLMQAPKNGFFYVVDRTNGKLISAEKYIPATWATGVDLATGRPIEAPNARFTVGPHVLLPGPFGGHNWHPMSFNPETGLVYFSAQELPMLYTTDENFRFIPGQFNTGVDWGAADFPTDLAEIEAILALVRGQLVAWDPAEQREVWRYQQAGPWNGGTLSTSGNLVFQGNVIGEFVAYSADGGARLWSFPTQTGITAGPVSWEMDNEQYVSVAVGWGTLIAAGGGPGVEALQMKNRSRVLTFKLGGEAELPPLSQPVPRGLPEPPEQVADADTIARGHYLYMTRCSMCHGLSVTSGGLISDLRYANDQVFERWNQIVVEGSLATAGMPSFKGILTPDEALAIKAFVIERAHDLVTRAKE